MNPFGAFGTLATGGRFIGRENYLGWLNARIIEGRSSAALIGLPKIGKTSLGQAFESECNSAGIESTSLNLTHFYSGLDFLLSFGSYVRPAGQRDETFRAESSQSAFQLIRGNLRALRQQGSRVIVICDNLDAVAQWDDGLRTLKVLRELVSDPSELPIAVLLLGRSPIEIVESALDGFSNLVGVVDERFLSPLQPDEVAQMARISQRTEDLALETFTHGYGHPLMCEAFLSDRFRGEQLGFDDVSRKTLASIHRFLRGGDLIPPLVDLSDGSLSLDPGLYRRLEDYGLAIEGEISPLGLAVLGAHVGDEALDPTSVASAGADLESLLSGGESQYVEFKESLCWDTRENRKNRVIENQVVRALASFSNADGGELLVGVADDGAVRGLERDFDSMKPRGRDGFEQFVREIVNTRTSDGNFGGRLRVRFYPFAEKAVCRISVPPGPHEVWCANETRSSGQGSKNAFDVFWVREGNRSIEKTAQALASYIRNRFPA